MIVGLIATWWVWLAVALGLAIVEVLASGFIFLGFSLGALATACFVFFATAPSVPALLAVFGVASLLSWVGLRLAFRQQSSSARIVHKDIND